MRQYTGKDLEIMHRFINTRQYKRLCTSGFRTGCLNRGLFNRDTMMIIRIIVIIIFTLIGKMAASQKN